MIITAFWCSFALVACNNATEADKEKLAKEVERLREERNQMTEESMKAQKMIDDIWYALNKLSGRTFDLERNKENGTVSQNNNKANEILKDIKAIKEKLNEAESAAGSNETMLHTIKNLRTTIVQKEKEIKTLKETISQLKESNSKLESSNNALTEQLQERNEQLEKTVNELQKSVNQERKLKLQLQSNTIATWKALGDELVSSVRKIGPNKGHGNLGGVKTAQLEMLKTAIDCYKKVYEMSRWQEDKEKLNRIIRGYNQYLESDVLNI